MTPSSETLVDIRRHIIMSPEALTNKTSWHQELKNRTSWLEEFSGGGLDQDHVADPETQTITICAAAGIVVVVLAVCALLCYREVNRRKLESGIIEEAARRETIKRSIQLKLQQLKLMEDSTSYMEHMEMKVPLVRFGDVVTINPAHTPASSNNDLHLYHRTTHIHSTHLKPHRNKQLGKPHQEHVENHSQQHQPLQSQQRKNSLKESDQISYQHSETSVKLSSSCNMRNLKTSDLTNTKNTCRHLFHDDHFYPLRRKPASKRSMFSFIGRKIFPRQGTMEIKGDFCSGTPAISMDV